MDGYSMLQETIEEFICEVIYDGEPGSDYDIFMVEEMRDILIDLLVRNQNLICDVLYNNEPSGEEPN